MEEKDWFEKSTDWVMDTVDYMTEKHPYFCRYVYLPHILMILSIVPIYITFLAIFLWGFLGFFVSWLIFFFIATVLVEEMCNTKGGE